MFIRKENNFNFTEFTNKVIKIAYTIINGISMPRIPREGKEWFQFTLETKVGE